MTLSTGTGEPMANQSPPQRVADQRQLEEMVRRRTGETIDLLARLREDASSIARLIAAVRTVLDRGGMLATAGNGGSAAEALHLAEELVGRYRSNRPPRGAISLVADSTALTCIGNDFGFDAIFERQVEALLRPGDALLVLSTSGRSPNLIRALDAARSRGVTTIGLLGRDGGPCRDRCDVSLVVPAEDSAQIQEAHQVIMHLICEALEPPSE